MIVFAPNTKQWRVYESLETEEMSHQEMVERASEPANEWSAFTRRWIATVLVQ